MKRILTVLLLISVLTSKAQNDDNQHFALTTSSFTVGVGAAKILDPYLSPFEYSGMQARIQHSSRRFFNPENDDLSFTHKAFLDGGIAYHPNRNNSMMFFNTNYSFGMNYHFRPANSLMLLTGGSWDINVGGKYLARNVNNPFSLDLHTNLNATAELQYLFKLWKHDFSLQYGAQSPVLGCMFVPMQGITYYELFVLNNLETAFHFSSLHNRRAWSHYLNLDIPLNFSTIRVSIQHDYLQYSANEMVFRKSGLNFAVGAVADLYVFSGKKRKIPANFVRSYE